MCGITDAILHIVGTVLASFLIAVVAFEHELLPDRNLVERDQLARVGGHGVDHAPQS